MNRRAERAPLRVSTSVLAHVSTYVNACVNTSFEVGSIIETAEGE